MCSQWIAEPHCESARELLDSSCKPPTTPAVPGPSAANNPPNSILPGASQTPDIFSALPLQNKRPCAPSPSSSSPPFLQFRQQSPRPRNSTSPAPPAACLQALDRPRSSANPVDPAPASD